MRRRPTRMRGDVLSAFRHDCDSLVLLSPHIESTSAATAARSLTNQTVALDRPPERLADSAAQTAQGQGCDGRPHGVVHGPWRRPSLVFDWRASPPGYCP